MDNVIFADSWEAYFAGLGLRRFDDFYNYDDATTVNRNRKRNVQRMVFGSGPDRRVFFMKRFERPHLKDMLAARGRGDRLVSQAGVEWRNAWYLLNHGIGTYEPVCVGERTGWGLEKASFFVTQELDAVCLLDLVLERWHSLDRRRQEAILVAVANLARTVHGLDISLPDLQVWHLYLHADDSADIGRLSVIDLHRMTQRVRSPRKKARDLSRLLWSMVPEYFDEGHRRLLMETYLDGLTVPRKRALQAVITNYEAALNARHTAHRYYKSIQTSST
ncbi:MAG: hypothetical protein GXX98_04275 [Planctomycetes bacterium]|nr:hypothetical protein [Planctomycetota bacterium]